MVTKSTTDQAETYTCDACGFKYPSEDLAQKCKEACNTKGICLSDVAKHAVSDDQA